MLTSVRPLMQPSNVEDPYESLLTISKPRKRASMHFLCFGVEYCHVGYGKGRCCFRTGADASRGRRPARCHQPGEWSAMLSTGSPCCGPARLTACCLAPGTILPRRDSRDARTVALGGRPLARCSVDSTLLLKGLEADIAVIPNAGV